MKTFLPSSFKKSIDIISDLSYNTDIESKDSKSGVPYQSEVGTEKAKGLSCKAESSFILHLTGDIMNLSFYLVNSDYCEYLRKSDPCVPHTMEHKSARPFVGIVFTINDFRYYAPLSSPKQKLSV